MTNISGTGNFGVNPHNFSNEGTKVTRQVGANDTETGAPKKEINLDESPEAVSGKAMVNIQGKGEYKFDPKNVENDVREFQLATSVGSVLRDYEQALIEQGYEPAAAQEKTAQFAACLMSTRNV